MPISGVRLSNAKLGVGARFHRLVSGQAQALGVSSEEAIYREQIEINLKRLGYLRLRFSDSR